MFYRILPGQFCAALLPAAYSLRFWKEKDYSCFLFVCLFFVASGLEQPDTKPTFSVCFVVVLGGSFCLFGSHLNQRPKGQGVVVNCCVCYKQNLLTVLSSVVSFVLQVCVGFNEEGRIISQLLCVLCYRLVTSLTGRAASTHACCVRNFTWMPVL